MSSLTRAVLMLALLALSLSQSVGASSVPTSLSVQPVGKGLTFQATLFPSYENSWTGRFSCNNCNPFEGDQPCSKELPLLCLRSAKTITRPHYTIATPYTPFAVVDGGYYDSWTGGILQVTLPVRGSDITSYQIGDKLCKGYFGTNSKFAQFDDGNYMPFMNQPPEKSWALWDWNTTKKGGWNLWGYFNHHYRGRAWVWVSNQTFGNCGH